jgi:hypothetical protein
MKILNYLIPSPLRKIDNRLLQHYPIVWETKIHYVLFYIAVANCFFRIVASLYSARELSYIPYENLVAQTWGWSFLFAMLAILYYAYQQSFVRIKVYSWRENILRYGLYLLGVSMIMVTTLSLPTTLINHKINTLYSSTEIKKDLIELNKIKYLGDLIREVRNSSISRQEEMQLLKLLQNHPLNQNQAFEKIIAFQDEFEKIYNFGKDKKWIEEVKQHPTWHPELKMQLFYQFKDEQNDDNEEHPKYFSDIADITLLMPSIQQKIAKYLPEYPESYNKLYRYEKRDLSFQLANLIAYKNDDFFLNSLKPHQIDNGLSYNHIKIFLHKGVSLSSSCSRKEIYTEPLELKEKELIELFIPQRKLEAAISQAWSQKNKDVSYAFQASAFFTLFLALLVLTAKIFTLRNLIISGFMMFASLFLLAFSLTTELFYIGDIRRILFQVFGSFEIFGISIYNSIDTDTPIVLFWLVPILIISVSVGLASYVQLKKINFRWIPLIWTFVLTSALVTTSVTSFVLLFRSYILNCDLLTQINFLYPTLAIAMFGMYVMYNQIAVLPQKK